MQPSHPCLSKLSRGLGYMLKSETRSLLNHRSLTWGHLNASGAMDRVETPSAITTGDAGVLRAPGGQRPAVLLTTLLCTDLHNKELSAQNVKSAEAGNPTPFLLLGRQETDAARATRSL